MNNLSQFRPWVKRMLPTVYDDSLTYQELLEKVIAYLNQVIDQSNEMVEFLDESTAKLLNEVKDLANQFDDVKRYLENELLPERISEVLNIWYDSGKLANIINNDVFGMKADKAELEAFTQSMTEAFTLFREETGTQLTDFQSGINTQLDTFQETINTQLRQLVVNVSDFGVLGDGVADDAPFIQEALDAVAEGGTVFFPDPVAFYRIESTLDSPSNVKWLGGATKPKLWFPSDRVENIVNIIEKENVWFEQLTFQNATSQTGWHLGEGKNGLSIERSQNIHFTECDFVEMGGQNAVWATHSKDLFFDYCRFHRNTYAMLSLRSETENIHVTNCEFDTLTSLDTPNTYTIVTGHTKYSEEAEFLTRNLHISKSKFLNNPRWEGLDTHGCLGLYVTDNYFENVRTGILAALDQRGNAKSIEHGDIYILNNIIKKGTATMVGSGISVSGHSNSNSGTGRLANNVVIKNNHVIGFGNPDSEYTPAVNASSIRHLTLENNVIEDSKQRGVNLGMILHGSMKGNRIINTHPAQDGAVFPVRMYQGVYFLDVEDNTIINNAYGLKQVDRGFRSTHRGLVNYGQNTVVALGGVYSVQNALMDGTVHGIKVGLNGTVARNQASIVTHYCSNQYVRSTAQQTGLTVTGTRSNRIVKTNAPALHHVAEGEEITIVNGGAGEDLTTILKRYIDHETIELGVDLQNNVTNASVLTLESNWIAV